MIGANFVCTHSAQVNTVLALTAVRIVGIGLVGLARRLDVGSTAASVVVVVILDHVVETKRHNFRRAVVSVEHVAEHDSSERRAA